MTAGALAAASALLALVVVAGALPASSHYVPQSGDRFDYQETIFLTNGVGNYTGYSEHSYYNGSIGVTGVLPNGTESASYAASGTWRNSLGASEPWSESGTFTFSAVTFHYVQGTDNQTGYTDPYVWFYMNNSLAKGGNFFLLNTPMKVVSRDDPQPYARSSTGYVSTIFAEGNGSYPRSDSYGSFTASYQWKAYFDPGTGYIVGYLYTETDRDNLGDGFTWTDTLAATNTTFPLTTAAAPPTSAAPSPWTSWVLVVGGIVVVLVVVVVVVALLRRRSRGGLGRTPLPRHAEPTVLPSPPGFGPPPPLDLTPRDQPLVQQIVLKETVKVPCRFCGTLIDSTAEACPKCGAPRT